LHHNAYEEESFVGRKTEEPRSARRNIILSELPCCICLDHPLDTESWVGATVWWDKASKLKLREQDKTKNKQHADHKKCGHFRQSNSINMAAFHLHNGMHDSYQMAACLAQRNLVQMPSLILLQQHK
jgi:hypothetical protein